MLGQPITVFSWTHLIYPLNKYLGRQLCLEMSNSVYSLARLCFSTPFKPFQPVATDIFWPAGTCNCWSMYAVVFAMKWLDCNEATLFFEHIFLFFNGQVL